MKKYPAFIISGFALFVSCVLTGCLKDKDYDNGLIQSTNPNGTNQNIVEIKLTAGSNTNVLITSFNQANADTTINFVPVNLSSGEAASQDIHVTLKQNDSLVSSYNNANGTNFQVPAAS